VFVFSTTVSNIYQIVDWFCDIIYLENKVSELK